MSEDSAAAPSTIARLRWIVPIAFLALTAWLLWREAGEFPLADIQRTLIGVPTLPALGVAALALIGVTFTGTVDWLIARWLKLGLHARDCFRLAFVANSMANTLNLSGAMGASVRLMGLSGLKVPLSRAAALIGMQALSLLSGLSLLVIATLATSSLPLTSGTAQRWVAGAVLIAAAFYLPLYFFLTARRALMRWLPQDVGIPPLRLKIELTLVSLIDWLLAAATLYACIYISGEHVKPGLLLGAFAGAGVLGLVSQVPGGLGVFDGLILLALSEAGYDKASVFSGLMLFRIAYYLLPLLIALYMGSEMLSARLPLLARLRTRLAGHPLFGLLGLPATLLADFGTRLLAILTFGAGALQLASAAIPSVSEHIVTVRAHLPILAVEGSNWFSVLSGVLLLGLARGIDGRLRLAYRVAQWLLLISAALAVTKGLHFGEALFLLAVAALLRARKRVFTRRAMTLTSARTYGWFAGLLLCVLVFFAIGVAQVLGDDSFDLFYIGFGEHTSRIGRGLAAALLGLVIYLIWQAFAVARPKLALPDRAELERARELYAAHGGGEFAHLTFMADKHLFWAADHQAVIAYGSMRDRLVALGSPCGSDAAIDRAILDFRHFADAQDRAPVFYEVLEPDLSRYHDLGFDLFKLGELALVRLAEFSLAGKRWEDLRQACNRAEKEKLTFTLVQPPFDTALLTDLERVSDAWLADKGGEEKGFSLGRFDPAYLSWSPLGLVHRDGELIAFANVLPPYGPGGHASVDLMRHVADTPRSTMDFLFAKVMLWAQGQGFEIFSLGMAPLSRVGDNPYARVNERLAALAFQYGNRFYNYQGVRKYKDKFKPEWIGSYLAYPRGLWVPGLLIDIAALVSGGYRRLLVG
ncbi:MAG: bifunctional lysylphosphatidylglycerol flippase/synthetase MprF [Xanthomonadaceae bacterium]|nr:bifunctional lysylphosphatidylglycerol flippase/synthetase MprF [Xanthomonadaceae bacterium]MDE1960326.1 bifunctional lysylphosphatidylglycerol flippase/synthetase MprF [Xanthomonadaceae bacterium]MDE2084438.1 bifunctional lysylphosphatidylglycerol flippase/synthetase MprF [Xanthomonadaceae bacterium]MDE2256335.1 bifunctional lysylphosphatidylglycerol flippase/synthetase MprF [Xanthomonadaceae bacterium]